MVSICTPRKRIDIHAVSKQWSLEAQRLARVEREERKFRGLRGRELVGGDYVLIQHGKEWDTATVSVCFEDPYGKPHGATVGHIAKEVGDEIFTFAKSKKNSKGNYPVVKIGNVVAICEETDSLIFEIDPLIPVCFYYVAVSASEEVRLTLSDSKNNTRCLWSDSLGCSRTISRYLSNQG